MGNTDLTDLEDLYQQVILDHSRSPRNSRRLDRPTGFCEGYNPVCGDRVEVFVRTEKRGTITDAAFTGSGCAICTASASMMTEALKGRNRADAEKLVERFLAMLTGSDPDEQSLDKLIVFQGVHRFPIRIKCATLPWHALKSALRGNSDSVATE